MNAVQVSVSSVQEAGLRRFLLGICSMKRQLLGLALAGLLVCLMPPPITHAASMMSGIAGKPLRLKITNPAEKAEAPWNLVLINGLPESFGLSKGTKLGNGSWSLTPEELKSVLVLSPRAYEGAVDLEIVFVASDNSARERTGVKLLVWADEEPTGEDTLPSTADATSPSPTSAPVASPSTADAPAPSPTPSAAATPVAVATPIAVAEAKSMPTEAPEQQSVTAEDIEDQIEFCRELMQNKRIAAARMMLEPLAQAGNAKAAHALGETYDPSVLTALKVKQERPNIVKARMWYTKAKELGDPNAQASLKALAALQRRNAPRPATPAPAQRNVN